MLDSADCTSKDEFSFFCLIFLKNSYKYIADLLSVRPSHFSIARCSSPKLHSLPSPFFCCAGLFTYNSASTMRTGLTQATPPLVNSQLPSSLHLFGHGKYIHTYTRPAGWRQQPPMLLFDSAWLLPWTWKLDSLVSVHPSISLLSLCFSNSLLIPPALLSISQNSYARLDQSALYHSRPGATSEFSSLKVVIAAQVNQCFLQARLAQSFNSGLAFGLSI